MNRNGVRKGAGGPHGKTPKTEPEAGPDGSEVLTVRQAAQYLNCRYATVLRMTQNGQIPALRVGRRWRFRRADIEKWIARMPRYQKYKLHKS